jgi:hypothetical protein
VIGEFTTPLVPGQSRNVNIHRALDLINGDVISPGSSYSLNSGIGPRTAARGFVTNGAIVGGDLVSAQGGGVSQVGVTFLNAAWESGIQIRQFRPHSIYFQRYPMCRDATLGSGNLDVVVRTTDDISGGIGNRVPRQADRAVDEFRGHLRHLDGRVRDSRPNRRVVTTARRSVVTAGTRHQDEQ